MTVEHLQLWSLLAVSYRGSRSMKVPHEPKTKSCWNSLILINSLKLHHSRGRFSFHAHICLLPFDATVLERGSCAEHT